MFTNKLIADAITAIVGPAFISRILNNVNNEVKVDSHSIMLSWSIIIVDNIIDASFSKICFSDKELAGKIFENHAEQDSY